MNNIKQSVINTFDRIGLDYQALDNNAKNITICNRFSGEPCVTTELIAECIDKVYHISNQYELGNMQVRLDDFDRLRYFILDQDKQAYETCID